MSGNWVAKLVGGVLIVGVAVGFKFYQKGASHDDTQAMILELCESDAECLAAVEQHFDDCHEQAFRLGGRRQAAHLDAQALVSCINSRSGQPFFRVD